MKRFNLFLLISMFLLGTSLPLSASAMDARVYRWTRMAHIEDDTTGSTFKEYDHGPSNALLQIYCRIEILTVNTPGNLQIKFEGLVNSLRCGGGANVLDGCYVDADCPGDTCDEGTDWETLVTTDSITDAADPYYVWWTSAGFSLDLIMSARADKKISAPIPPRFRLRSAITGAGDFDYIVDCLETF